MQTNDLYNGREAEVIAQVCTAATSNPAPWLRPLQFSDGYSYSKTKLDASLRELVQDRKSVKSVKGQVAVKRDDVDLVVRVFDTDAIAMSDRVSDEGV